MRVGRLELTSLALAFVLSLALHLGFWGTYLLGKHFHWWDKVRWPAWVQKLTQPPSSQPKQPPVNREPPLMFVEVAEPSVVAPKETKFYSDQNAVAANLEPKRDAKVPEIDGKQEHVIKTEDVARNKFPLAPDPPKPPPPAPEKEPVEDAQPKPAPAPGTMTVAKADLKPQPVHKRPRTIKEALLQRHLSPGQKMKQAGGVDRRGRVSPDAKMTGFGAYDRQFIDAVKSRWFDLLDNMSYDAYRSGYVKLEFNLNYDGRITEMKVLETTVTETLTLLCQKAVLDPAPFDRWPREMRLMIGEDTRKITFTFYYD